MFYPNEMKEWRKMKDNVCKISLVLHGQIAMQNLQLMGSSNFFKRDAAN